MKKIMSMLLTVCLVFSLLPMGTLTAIAATSGYYTYTVSGGKATITDVNTSISGAVTIPSTLGGAPVKSIGYRSFAYCRSLTSITLPDSVTSIGKGAFYYCTSLTSITVDPDNPVYHSNGNCLIETATDSLVLGCQTSVIPSYITSIGDWAFYGCDSLTSITLPNSVTSIGDEAFYGCTKLTSLTIPNSVTSIGDSAFYGCDSLTSIMIPNSVTSIGDSAFYNCTKLTSITIPDSVTSIGNYAFEYCDSLTSITIPNSVTSIGNYAFYDCDSLTSITIPDSVTSIGNGAFYDCFSLTSITLPNSVTSIGDSAFYGCTSLTSITIPNSVTSIGDSAFSSCYSLTSITIPDSVTSIGYRAFSSCDSLTSITIPNSVTSVGDSAFEYCRSLTSITLPNSVTSIGYDAFYDCDSLTDVWYFGESREDIVIGSGNSSLKNATWHYVSTCPGEHLYSGECDDTCNVCGNTRTVPDHIYDNVCDTACNECGSVRTAPHAYDNACDAVCNECGDSRTVPDHVYDNACDVDCNECGDIRTVPDHLYDNACDTDCNECGFTRTVPDHDYTLNGGHTCGECGVSKTPVAPTVAQKTNHSVTLAATDGFEYSKDGTTWQDSPVFDNLANNTSYTFCQRVKASATAQVSGISGGTTVTFKSAQSQLSAPMVLSFTDTTVILAAVDGAEYSVDGVNWQTDPTFADLSPAVTYAFYQRLAETATHEAGDSSPAFCLTTDKSKQTAVPDAPMLQSVTFTSITLVEVDGCEYSKNGKTWQASPVFTNLDPTTSYTFYQRYKETATHYAGKASAKATFTTEKATLLPPAAPTLLSKTHNTITLAAHDGYEYSIGGGVWQTSPVFTGLSPETNYIFYQRIAESDEHYATAASSALIVKTDAHPLFDDEWDTADVRFVLKSMVGLSAELTEEETFYADFDEDGKVNSADVRRMLMLIASLA